MSGETHRTVIAAITGNVLIATTKLIAAALSGSASMLSQGIHSLVDTCNGGLMLERRGRGGVATIRHSKDPRRRVVLASTPRSQ